MGLFRFVAAVLLAVSLGVTSVGGAIASTPGSTIEPLASQILFPEGTVLRITNFSALARFTVSPPGAQFVGAFHADHSLWIMAWTNGTPMPMCPIAQGYVGSPMNASYDEKLIPETYTFSEVCGGLGNLTVTQTIELVYGSGGGNGTGGGDSGALSVNSFARSPLLVSGLALLGLAAVGATLSRRKSHRPPAPPPPRGP